MLSPTNLALHLPLSAFRACARAYTAKCEIPQSGVSVKAASRSLLARLGVAELVFGELALEQVNGALKEGQA